MGFGAILAGAAGGLNSGWEDNREDAKEKAKQAFQEHLLGIQQSNALARDEVQQANTLERDEIAGERADVVRSEIEGSDALAKNKQVGIDADVAKQGHEYKMKEIGANKSSRMTKPNERTDLVYLKNTIDTANDVLTSDFASEPDKEEARKVLAWAQPEYAKRSGMPGREPPAKQFRAPTEAHKAEMLKNMGNDKFKASYIANFGQEHFDALPNQPGGTGTPDPTPKQKTLSQKYPSNKQGPLKGILESVNPWSDKQTSKEQQSRADSIMKSMDRVSQALAKGTAPEGMDMSILESAMGLPWIPDAKKAEIENIYEKAAGR